MVNIKRLEMKSIINNNKINTDVSLICEVFNDKFSLVVSRIHETIPPLSSANEFSYYLHDIQVNTPLTFSSVQISEVGSTIFSLKENKAHIFN